MMFKLYEGADEEQLKSYNSFLMDWKPRKSHVHEKSQQNNSARRGSAISTRSELTFRRCEMILESLNRGGVKWRCAFSKNDLFNRSADFIVFPSGFFAGASRTSLRNVLKLRPDN